MKVGDPIIVKINEQISDNTLSVVNLENNTNGVLNVKGKLKKQKDGTIKAWIIKYNKKTNWFLCGNAYFGKYSISEGISEKYISILSDLFNNPLKIKDLHISILKGMCNRCLKYDQWDWFTTYQYLGFPAKSLLRNFVSDCTHLRNELRNGNYNTLAFFLEKYSFMLRSMQFHLTINPEIENNEIKLTIEELEETEWSKLTNESKENIKMIRKFFNSNSAYFLMYFFVTLEQEFINNFITPFIEHQRVNLTLAPCLNIRYVKTHNILIGKENFSLGAILFLGRLVSDTRALNESSAIREFNIFLDIRKDDFKNLCIEICNCKIDNLSLSALRNGIAHGDSKIISTINPSVNTDLYNIFFTPPHELIHKILKYSIK